MVKRLVIAIDCDDVLIATTEYIVEKYNRQYATAVTLDRSHDHDNTQWGVEDGDELWLRFSEIQSSSEYAKILPDQEALRVVKRLAEDHELHLVTARDESIEHTTEMMLSKYLPGCFSSMEHVGRGRSKGEVCVRLKADILIDDSLRNLQSALEHGLRPGGAIHFGDYAWNQAKILPAGVVACKNWSEVVERIESID